MYSIKSPVNSRRHSNFDNFMEPGHLIQSLHRLPSSKLLKRRLDTEFKSAQKKSQVETRNQSIINANEIWAEEKYTRLLTSSSSAKINRRYLPRRKFKKIHDFRPLQSPSIYKRDKISLKLHKVNSERWIQTKSIIHSPINRNNTLVSNKSGSLHCEYDPIHHTYLF